MIERFATLRPFRRVDFMYLERNERKIKGQSEEDGTNDSEEGRRKPPSFPHPHPHPHPHA